MDTPATLSRLLCESWCAELDAERVGDGVRMSLPLTELDGDAVTVWLSPTFGGWRISDQGTTLMRLSYQHDIDSLLEGTRGQVFERILTEHSVCYDDGRLIADVAERDLAGSLLQFGHAIQRISDLRFWTRTRVASSFYDDLSELLASIVGVERIHRDYAAPNVPSSGDYPIDFYVDGGAEPLYVFGVPTKDKARLATIVLQHLQQHAPKFNSLVVFQNVSELASKDMKRLMNAANDMVDSIDSIDALERKVRHRVAA